MLEPSDLGLQTLVRQGGSGSGAAIDLSEVPSALKCALTGKLMRDAAELPCCKKVRVTLDIKLFPPYRSSPSFRTFLLFMFNLS